MAVSLDTVAMYEPQIWDKMDLWNSNPFIGEPSNFIKERQSRTRTLIRNLQTKEQQLLDMIAPGLKISELRERIKTYHKQGFSLLSHADAEKIVLRYKLAVAKYNLETVDKFVEWFWSNSNIKAAYDQVIDKTNAGKVVEKIILDIVNSSEFVGPNKGGRIQSHKRIRDTVNKYGLDPYKILNILGEVTVERLKTHIGIIDGLQKPRVGDKNLIFDLPLDDGTHQYIDWYGLTQGQTGGKVKKAIEKGKISITTIENNFAEAIASYLSQEKNLPLSISEIDKIVRYIIRINPTAPFMGMNEKGITGLLGEIQALCYFRLLLGDKFNLENKNVYYAARDMGNNNLGDSGAYHADIVLDKMGIQVKNTTKELTDWVHFNEGSIDAIIEGLKKEGTLKPQLGSIVKDIYTTYYFNIPYLWDPEGKQLISTYNEDYAPTNEYLEEYIQTADLLLTYLYDYFMYIGLGDASINQKGNVLFIVNGDTAILASEILLNILDQIKNAGLTAFKIERPERGSKNIENIVSFTNNNNLYKFKGNQGFISNKASKVVATLHQQISRSITFTSSYDFSSLITKFAEQ